MRVTIKQVEVVVNPTDFSQIMRLNVDMVVGLDAMEHLFDGNQLKEMLSATNAENKTVETTVVDVPKEVWEDAVTQAIENMVVKNL